MDLCFSTLTFSFGAQCLVFNACDDSLWTGLSHSVRRSIVWCNTVISACDLLRPAQNKLFSSLQWLTQPSFSEQYQLFSWIITICDKLRNCRAGKIRLFSGVFNNRLTKNRWYASWWCGLTPLSCWSHTEHSSAGVTRQYFKNACLSLCNQDNDDGEWQATSKITYTQ